jgi:4-hydroxybenzoate polyprenyltransferase
MNFLRLIRYQNLLMLAAMQLVFRYGFLEWYNVPLALKHWQFALLVLATVAIAAAGYLINNIMDRDTDQDNKPEKVVVGKSISETQAYNYYFILNGIGVLAGAYLSFVVGKWSFAMIFISIVMVLYMYATSFKQNLLVGNFLVALLLSISVLIIGIFDMFPVVDAENRVAMGLIFGVMIDYAIFAFIINFLREIVKDLEDVNGDYNQCMNTLPIVLGVARTAILVFWLSFIPIGVLLFYINEYFVTYNLWIIAGYGLALVVAPLIYFTVRMFSAKTQKDFKHLSLVLKVVLFFGIISVAVLTYNLKSHA